MSYVNHMIKKIIKFVGSLKLILVFDWMTLCDVVVQYELDVFEKAIWEKQVPFLS